MLKQLMEKISIAAKEGKFYSQNKSNQTTVHFWTQEVISSLSSVGAAEVMFLKLSGLRVPKLSKSSP